MPSATARLQTYLHESIPLVRHMQIVVDTYDEHGLSLSAPLAANINHKSTAFGGSLAALATLSCWGLLWLLLEPQADTHLVVRESHMHYLHPVTDTLVAVCPQPADTARQRFLDTLRRRGKARLELEAHILQQQTVCAKFSGQFVAYRDAAD
ncbi:MAG TPA: thioesterase domain-containing protein [Gammaproteobacteria bacterium]|nr:thioesterase domain-containing protein [Gammaproteobacteria bacterium]